MKRTGRSSDGEGQNHSPGNPATTQELQGLIDKFKRF